jgi:hypothetical protein
MRGPAGREQPLVACCKPIGGFMLGFSVPCTGRCGRRAFRLESEWFRQTKLAEPA